MLRLFSFVSELSISRTPAARPQDFPCVEYRSQTRKKRRTKSRTNIHHILLRLSSTPIPCTILLFRLSLNKNIKEEPDITTDEINHAELIRLKHEEERAEGANWKQWGPYLSERQWGTVREDYSHDGSPWSSFPHDHARGRAYRWG